MRKVSVGQFFGSQVRVRHLGVAREDASYWLSGRILFQ